MPQIRPVSDLRNNFTDISKVVHETLEPIFLTKNGYGDMVVMSIEAYENFKLKNEIHFKLKEAEIQSQSTDVRYTHQEVFDNLRSEILKKVSPNDL
ncbi:MAG: type II toxin-antitoxin system Phd/YefM family antitoxin [Clostridia bacterium]